VLGFCPITSLTMHYSVSEGTPVGIQHVEEKLFFFLDIKKFLYTHEKDEYNDINKRIFEKMY
jgi:hypothetical protein